MNSSGHVENELNMNRTNLVLFGETTATQSCLEYDLEPQFRRHQKLRNMYFVVKIDNVKRIDRGLNHASSDLGKINRSAALVS